ncbi:hypothetical protein Tco_0775085 [Tanacetum coccineum]
MTPRSCLRWKPTGKIFKTVGLRWVPTGKIFTSGTTKVDSESISTGLEPNSMAPGHNGARLKINNLQSG